jgi:quercetin dioxygenase-like cupin family protein
MRLPLVTAFALILAAPVAAKDTYPPLEVLLSSSETIIGQTIDYPEGPAKITAAIVTMLPGASTGAHVHNAPLFAYMLEGELTVDYGPDGKRTYREGDSLLEAFRTPHDGTNTGTGIARVLVVFAGADGVANTESVE